MIWGREPVLVLSMVQAAIALAVGFGLKISADQLGLIVAFTAAVLGFITRSQVSPLGAPTVPASTALKTP